MSFNTIFDVIMDLGGNLIGLLLLISRLALYFLSTPAGKFFLVIFILAIIGAADPYKPRGDKKQQKRNGHSKSYTRSYNDYDRYPYGYNKYPYGHNYFNYNNSDDNDCSDHYNHDCSDHYNHDCSHHDHYDCSEYDDHSCSSCDEYDY